MPFPPREAFEDLIRLAVAEDLGPKRDDVTSRLCFDEGQTAVATLVQKQAGVICGLPIVPHVCAAYSTALRVEPVSGTAGTVIVDGAFHGDEVAGASVTPLLTIAGPLRALLSAERVLLNFVQHLSGVATMTRRFVDAVAGTRARIIDTRKTLPGFRLLDKYAVRCGGGANHRVGLYDMVLVKDNHLAGRPLVEVAAFVRSLVKRCAAERVPLEVEVDRLDQLEQVLQVDGVDYVLLDNMPPAMMARAVALRDAAPSARKPLLEASGGVNLSSVRAIAESGVDRISVGALTHSAPALDVGLDI